MSVTCSILTPVIPFSPRLRCLCPADTAIKLSNAPLLLLVPDAVIQFGLGSKLVAASFCLLLIISFISLAVPVANGGGEPTAVPTADATGTAAVNATDVNTKV